VTLPWWDWSKDATIPSAYSVAQAGGEQNVLAKAPIKAFNTAHKSGWPNETSRAPGEVPQTPSPPYQQEWAYAMKAATYADFSQRIWAVHDTLHVWVGGTMGQVDWAAVSAFDRRPPHPLLPFNATLEITESLGARPDDTGEITVTVLAFNKNSDSEGVLRFKELTLLTYA